MSDVFDVFVSYAHSDNATGWVSGLRDSLVEDFASFGRPLRVFLDTRDIRTMDDWEHRILGALEFSRVLLICQSPSYYASEFCRREWVEFLARHRDGRETVAVVYFVEVPQSDTGENAEWRRVVAKSQYADLQPFFDQGVRALLLEDVRDRVTALGTQVWERIDRALRAEAVPGNVSRRNPFFVGRGELIRCLHEQVGTRGAGRVTLVQGLGGMGKTELVVQYAHAYRDQFPGGVWQVDAEGATDLLACLASLAGSPELGLALEASERNDPVAAGRRVLAELRRRCPGVGDRTLVLLDNVSDAAVLSARQVAALPDEGWLRVVATTRLGLDAFPAGVTQGFEVGPLALGESVQVIREQRPARDAERRFPELR